MAHNQLTGLPDTLGKLTALKNLGLNDNKIVALPRTLARGVSARQRVEAKAALAEAKDFLGWVLVPPPPPLDSTTVRTARHVGPNRAAIESG